MNTHLATLDTSCGKFVFITFTTINVFILGHKTFGTNGNETLGTYKTLFMPLFAFILQLTLARFEHFGTLVAPDAEQLVVTVATIDPF